MNTSNTYLKLCTEYYDLTKPHAPENELLFYLDYAKRACGPILEPMCGTGRFLIPMLELGFDIEGFDSSPYMLDLLQQKSAQKKLTPTISQCLLQEFNSHKKYSLIFIPSGSFGLITDPAQAEESLGIIYNHLLPDAKLVFEVDTPQSLKNYPLGNWQQSARKRGDGSSLVFNKLPFYNTESHIFEVLCRYEHVHNGTILATEIENFYVKLYEDGELDLLLHQIGFSVVKYKNHEKSAASDTETITIIYECTK